MFDANRGRGNNRMHCNRNGTRGAASEAWAHANT